MHQPSNDKPTQAQLIFPLLETIADNGGRLSAREAAAALAKRFALPPAVTGATKVSRDGKLTNVYQRHVRFTKLKAKEMGFIIEDARDGAWTLTDAGAEAVENVQPAVLLEVLRTPDGVVRAVRVNTYASMETSHLLVHGDSRNLDWMDSQSIPLVCTSIPYFDLRDYGRGEGQLSTFREYASFLDELTKILAECYRVLIPGGRMALNTGDVLRSRAKHGAHHVLPLHADVIARSTRLGFHYLNGIIWNKPGNCTYENGRDDILGTAGAPNGIIKLETEHILILRRPGPYRSVTRACAAASQIAPEDYRRWFRGIWNDVSGVSTRDGHPAPYPLEVARRIIGMFSHKGDTVLDVCAGKFSTSVAAAVMDRSSIGIEAELPYVKLGVQRMRAAAHLLAAA